jgi:hypothetical protein
MIDPLKEDVFPFNHARNFFPRRRQGKHPSLSCLYRWSGKGCRGVVLESVNVGGTRCTSREAVARFIRGLSVSESPGNTLRAPAARDRASRRAQEELHRLGL